MADLSIPEIAKTIRVLHVDDDASIQEITKLILLDLNPIFDIDNACCADEGLQKLASEHYDVVISDYEMPQKNGLEFLKELRKQKNEIPFILFTGKGREEVAIKALNLGADGYHNKQGSPETVYGELSHSIKLIVERNKTKIALQEQENRFAKLAAQTPGMLFQFLKKPNGAYSVPFASDGICNIFGCSPQEVKNDFSPIIKVIFPADLEKVMQSIEQSAAQLSLWQCEYRVQLPGQETRWLWGQSNPEKLEDGSILWSGFNTDITERKRTEEELRGTLNVLERVGEGIDAGLAIIGKDYDVIWANKHIKDFGPPSNKKCYQTFNNLNAVCPNCGVKKIFEQNVSFDSHEYETVNSKGEKTWIELRVTPLKDQKGATIAALELAVPITEHKKVEQIIKESEEKYRKLFEESIDAIFVADIETGKIVDCNYAASKLVSRQKSELIGQHQSIFTPKEQMEGEFAKVFKQHFKDQTQSLETQIIRKTGEIRDVSVRDTVFELNGKKLMQGTMRDITEQKKAEKSKLLDEVRLQCILDINKMLDASDQELMDYAMDAITKITQSDFAFIDLLDQNETVMTIYSWSKTAMKECKVQVKPIHCPVSEAGIWAEPIRQRKPVNIDDYSVHLPHKKGYPEGHVKIERFLGVPIFEKEHIVAIAAVANKKECYDETDVGYVTSLITDMWRLIQRKRAEKEFAAEQALVQEVVNSTDAMIFSVDRNYRYTSFNFAHASVMKAIYGGDIQIGKSILDYMTVAIDREKAKGNIDKALCGEKLVEEAYSGDDQLARNYFIISHSPIRDSKGEVTGVVVVSNDISERKKAEAGLHESQQKFKAMFSANPEAALFVDTDFHVVEANSRFSTLFGYSFDEIKGKIVTDLIVPDDSKEESRISHQKILSGPTEIVTTRKRKDGSLIPLFMSGGPVSVNGNVIGSVIVYKDLSDIITVQEELSKALDKAELLNEKLHVVGSLTRHDVGNKLMVVKSNLYLIKKQIGDNPNLGKYFEGIDSAIRQSDELFEFNRFYEKIGLENLSEIDVAKSFNQAALLLPNLGSIKIVNDCQGLMVTADSLLKQLFYNLLDNSLKHGEKVTQMRLHYTKDSDGVKLFFEDNGVGIPEANKPKLFQEGFTTGKSTGLGLFLIKKMVEVYGWSITEDGEPGKGIKFIITIPKFDKSWKHIN